jgi:hypothetical protein
VTTTARRTATLALLATAAVTGLGGTAHAGTRTAGITRPSTVTVAGTTCAKAGEGWAVTVRWAATGGRYVDLGSPGAWSRTTVSGGRRTWQAKVSVLGWTGVPGPVPAPTSVTLGWGELVAPTTWHGDLTREQYWQGAPVSVPVTCR